MLRSRGKVNQPGHLVSYGHGGEVSTNFDRIKGQRPKPRTRCHSVCGVECRTCSRTLAESIKPSSLAGGRSHLPLQQSTAEAENTLSLGGAETSILYRCWPETEASFLCGFPPAPVKAGGVRRSAARGTRPNTPAVETGPLPKLVGMTVPSQLTPLLPRPGETVRNTTGAALACSKSRSRRLERADISRAKNNALTGRHTVRCAAVELC